MYLPYDSDSLLNFIGSSLAHTLSPGLMKIGPVVRNPADRQTETRTNRQTNQTENKVLVLVAVQSVMMFVNMCL